MESIKNEYLPCLQDREGGAEAIKYACFNLAAQSGTCMEYWAVLYRLSRKKLLMEVLCSSLNQVQ